MRFALVLIALAAMVGMTAGCQATKSPEAAYHVNGQGQVSAATRSAMNGSTAPGPQEIIGVYLPFIGTGLAMKAGLEWDGIPGTITVPIGGQSQVLPAPTQAVMVPQQVLMESTEMVPQMQSTGPCTPAQQVMVPQKVWKPAARMVPLPIPVAPQAADCK